MAMWRPNARISDARKRDAARRAGGPSLPPVVQTRIAEAGASAYEWRDSVLRDLYMPPQELRIALRAALWVFQALVAVAVALVALQGGALLLVVALTIPVASTALFYLATKEPTAPPTLSWVAAAGVASIPMISAAPAWGALGVILLVASVLVSHEVEHPLRGEISAWASAVATVAAGALSHSSGLAWWPTAVWVVALIAVQVPICTLHRSFRSAFHRITPEDLLAKVPDPDFRWQGMVDVLRRVPGIAFVASAFSSHGWLAQVLEDPPQHVMAEARKKAAGAYGERKTGVFLLALARGKGTVILHDIALPGAKSANIDHVVITKNLDGKPCAFVIDSKFYGPSRLPSREFPEGKDPGEVTYDMATGGYVHRLGARSREIDKSISTALWGADAVRRVTGIEDVRVIMAIHNANVAPHLSFSRDGVPVQIVSAWDLVDVIDQASPERPSWLDRLLRRSASGLSPMQEARIAQGLSAASGALKPSMYGPLGRTRKAGEFMSMQGRQARGGTASAHDLRFGPSGPPPGVVKPEPPMPPASSERPTFPSPSPMPQEETPFQRADREFFDSDPSEWADDSPPRPPVPPAESASERLEGLWQDMRDSTPAPLDDVPAQFHQIVRGTPLTITSFNEERGPVAQDVVAITGVCVGAPGNLFLWYCSPEGWKQYQTTGMPVFISTIKAESVVARSGGGE